MRDSVLWLIRSSQKATEFTAFSKLPSKVDEEPNIDALQERRILVTFVSFSRTEDNRFSDQAGSMTRFFCVAGVSENSSKCRYLVTF